MFLSLVQPYLLPNLLSSLSMEPVRLGPLATNLTVSGLPLSTASNWTLCGSHAT